MFTVEKEAQEAALPDGWSKLPSRRIQYKSTSSCGLKRSGQVGRLHRRRQTAVAENVANNTCHLSFQTLHGELARISHVIHESTRAPRHAVRAGGSRKRKRRAPMPHTHRLPRRAGRPWPVAKSRPCLALMLSSQPPGRAQSVVDAMPRPCGGHAVGLPARRRRAGGATGRDAGMGNAFLAARCGRDARPAARQAGVPRAPP